MLLAVADFTLLESDYGVLLFSWLCWSIEGELVRVETTGRIGFLCNLARLATVLIMNSKESLIGM